MFNKYYNMPECNRLHGFFRMKIDPLKQKKIITIVTIFLDYFLTFFRTFVIYTNQ